MKAFLTRTDAVADAAAARSDARYHAGGRSRSTAFPLA